VDHLTAGHPTSVRRRGRSRIRGGYAVAIRCSRARKSSLGAGRGVS
jgi:hypothetical protein